MADLSPGTKPKPLKLVGNFIRLRREALNLSQRALGMLFDPPVTTQFVSNVERGVTPLPPVHVPILSKALLVGEQDILELLEKEYMLKLAGRLGKNEGDAQDASQGITDDHRLDVRPEDLDFMKKIYEAYRAADETAREQFAKACMEALKLKK